MKKKLFVALVVFGTLIATVAPAGAWVRRSYSTIDPVFKDIAVCTDGITFDAGGTTASDDVGNLFNSHVVITNDTQTYDNFGSTVPVPGGDLLLAYVEQATLVETGDPRAARLPGRPGNNDLSEGFAYLIPEITTETWLAPVAAGDTVYVWLEGSFISAVDSGTTQYLTTLPSHSDFWNGAPLELVVEDCSPGDVTPPEFAPIDDISVTTEDPTGTIITYTDPTAADDTDDGPVPVDCTPASGTFFATGTTTVACTATDTSGNTANATFDVTVTYQPPAADVTIDVAPWSRRNIIWISYWSYTSVAIKDIDPTATYADLAFGPNGATPVYERVFDIDRDGDQDLYLVYRVRHTGITCGDTTATLTGTINGTPFTADDTIRTRGWRCR